MAEPSDDHEPTAVRLRVLGTPRHRCGGCGACCASYRVGPLTSADLAQLEQALPKIREQFPDQVDGEYTYTLRSGEQEAHYLRKKDGYCVLFQHGLGCTVHAAAGSDKKPLACQLFPLQLVDTDAGIRLGNRPTCLNDWQVWADGPPLTGEFIEKVLSVSRRAPPRPAAPAEEATLRLLRLPDLDTATLLSFLAERKNQDDPPAIEPWLEERVVDLFAAADSVQGGEFSENALGPLHPSSVTAAEFTAFRLWAEQREHATWPEVHDGGLPYLRDALARLVFLRQTALYPTFAWALLGFICAARWASAYSTSAVPAASQDIQGGPSFDMQRFGHCFSTLLVILESPRMQRSILEAGPPFA